MAEGDDRSVESRRILDRVGHEAEAGGASIVKRTVRRAQDHVSAADAEADDPIEVWGTRIGRTLGMAVTIGLIIWLAFFLLRGG
jgi:hypothetical protein